VLLPVVLVLLPAAAAQARRGTRRVGHRRVTPGGPLDDGGVSAAQL
jgi:hypothetical protein